MTNPPYQSVERIFTVIDELAQHGEMGVSELADRVDIPVSTAHDYLQSLVETGYVMKDGQQYHISTKFLDAGYKELNRSQIYSVAQNELSRLATETGEHVSLMKEERGKGVLLDVRKGKNSVKFRAWPGVRVELHTTAPGKAILAHMPPERVDDLIESPDLAAPTQYTTTDPDTLQAQFEEIREKGYAVDENERISGLVTVAAPILDRKGDIQGAFSVAGPRNRFGAERQQAVGQLVREAANVVQVEVDYS